MNEPHLREMEQALAAEQQPDELGLHAGWCRECRNGVEEYRWLERAISAALDAQAEAVPLPRPRWRRLRRSLRAGQQQLARQHLSAATGVVLAVCVLLLASSLVGTALVAHTLSPEAASAPPPLAAAALTVAPTPTPAQSTRLLASTPALILHPTPPERATAVLTP